MEKLFEKNVVKPGDSDYKYDNRKEFKPTKIDPEWEVDDDDEIVIQLNIKIKYILNKL